MICMDFTYAKYSNSGAHMDIFSCLGRSDAPSTRARRHQHGASHNGRRVVRAHRSGVCLRVVARNNRQGADALKISAVGRKIGAVHKQFGP